MSFDLILWLVCIAVIAVVATIVCLGFINLRKYNKLLAYLREHHPAAYEQARPKPIWRHVYLRGAADQALIKFTAHHEPLNDPTAEALLADYLQFSHRLRLTGLLLFAGGFSCIWCMCGPLGPFNPSSPFASIWDFVWRLVQRR